MSTASSIADAGAEELVRQLRGIAGELGPEYKTKAQSIATTALLLATDYANGTITAKQFGQGKDALVLAARSIAAEAGLDLLGKRKAVAESVVAVLLRVTMAALV